MTVKMIANCNNISSVNPLYLIINKMIGHFEEKNGNKQMMQMKTKKFQKKYKEVWEGIKKEIETINDGKKMNTGKILKKLGLSLMMICH